MEKELNVKEIILRLLAGGILTIYKDDRKDAWLYVAKKGRIKVNEAVVNSLFSGSYLKKITKEVKGKEYNLAEYKFNVDDRIRGISKLSKEELNVFIMHVWKVDIRITDNFYGTITDQIDHVFSKIHTLFYMWYKERRRYLDKLNELLEDDD
jgi:hypothetical protein